MAEMTDDKTAEHSANSSVAKTVEMKAAWTALQSVETMGERRAVQTGHYLAVTLAVRMALT